MVNHHADIGMITRCARLTQLLQTISHTETKRIALLEILRLYSFPFHGNDRLPYLAADQGLHAT